MRDAEAAADFIDRSCRVVPGPARRGHGITRRVVLGASLGASLGAAPLSAGALAAGPDAGGAGPAAVADYMEMAGNVRLDPPERAAIEAAERRVAAGGVRDSWGQAAAVLARFRGQSPIGQAGIRHPARAALHFAVHQDRTAIGILSRRDPVLVEDAARQDVVTMADLRAMAATNEFVAGLAGQTAPPLREEPGDREKLRAAYAAQPGMRVATTQAGLRHATVEEVWRRLDPSKQAEIAALIRDKVRDGAAVPDAARELENILVAAVQKARNDAAWADFNRHMARMGQATVEMARLSAVQRNLDLMHHLFRP